MKALIKTLSTASGIALLAIAISVFSCNKDETSSSTSASINVMLTDGPGDVDALFIDVKSVEIHSDQTGWVAVTPINAGIYNLLDFTNGADTLLGSAELPAGSISQMRLILGENNTVVIDSVTHDLKTPSAQQSGLKFNIHQDLTAGITYDVWIDFDAGRSVVEKGNGTYSLKPVVRAFTNATSGAIKGIVAPDSAASYVFAVQATDTFATFADTNGMYLIKGVPAGTYDVNFDNVLGYKDTVINGVSVSTGIVTDMDTTTMSK